MAIIGSMAVNIVAKTDEFIRGINNAQKQLRKFVNFSGWLRTAGTGFLGQQIKEAIDAAGELTDLSAATGIAIEQLDFLKYAARQTGADIGNVMKGIKELINKGISPDRLEEVADRLNRITDPTKRARLAMELLGKRSGLALLPMLRDLPALRKKFAELGGAISTSLANRMDNLGDSFDDVRLAIRNTSLQIADALLPAIKSSVSWAIKIARATGEWSKQHPWLIEGLAKAAFAVGVLTPACWALNQALGAIKNTLIAIKAIQAAGGVMGLIALLTARPELLAALAVAGVAAYKLYREARYQFSQSVPRPTAEAVGAPAAGKEHLKEQRRTNDILSQMVRGGSRGPAAVMVAGESE